MTTRSSPMSMTSRRARRKAQPFFDHRSHRSQVCPAPAKVSLTVTKGGGPRNPWRPERAITRRSTAASDAAANAASSAAGIAPTNAASSAAVIAASNAASSAAVIAASNAAGIAAGIAASIAASIPAGIAARHARAGTGQRRRGNMDTPERSAVPPAMHWTRPTSRRRPAQRRSRQRGHARCTRRSNNAAQHQGGY